MRSKVTLTEKLASGALVTPTPEPKSHGSKTWHGELVLHGTSFTDIIHVILTHVYVIMWDSGI